MSEHRAFRDELALLLKARFPLLYIESFEEGRVLAEIRAVAADPERIRTPRPVWVWSATSGLVGPDGSAVAASTDPGRALDRVAGHDDPAVFVFCDLHASLGAGQRPADPAVVRRLLSFFAVAPFEPHGFFFRRRLQTPGSPDRVAP